MADLQKIETIKQSIADWQAKLESESGAFSPDVVNDVINKLKADLAAAEAE